MALLPARKADGSPVHSSVDAAVAALRRGELVILPTDTVYGLAADSTNAEAVARLFTAKGRADDKPIALLAASAAQAGQLADLGDATVQQLAAHWWPGALTIVARCLRPLPPGLTSPTGAVGVRVPADRVVQAVAKGLGRPLAVTSANRSGEPPATTVGEAIRVLASSAALALDGGPCPIGTASTVVDCTGSELVVLRQGSVDVGTVGPS